MADIENLLAELKRLQPGSPECEAYLERLRELVATGGYRIDSEALSRKLIESVTKPKA